MMLRTRLAMGIGGIVALMLVPVGLSLLSLRELRKDTERIRDQEFQAAVVLGKVRAAVQELDQAKDYLSILPEEATLTQFNQKLTAVRILVDSLDQVNGIAGINRVRGALRSIADESDHAHQLAAAGRTATADSVIDKVISPPIDDIERIVALSEQANQDRTRERVNDIAIESVVRATPAAAAGRGGLLRSSSACGSRSRSRVLSMSSTRCGPSPRDFGHSAPRASAPDAWAPRHVVQLDGDAAPRTRPTQGRIHLRRLARTQDADQRRDGLPATPAGERLWRPQ
jgi:hypothetical protein